MFESLRQAFREAVENFHTELNRDALPEATDRLLAAMSTEVVDAHRRLDELRAEIGEVRNEAKREEEMARTCVRREEMARGIGDSETQEVARQFALRHLRRKEVLDEKAEVLEREVRGPGGGAGGHDDPAQGGPYPPGRRCRLPRGDGRTGETPGSR
jgi:hypothetical protein